MSNEARALSLRGRTINQEARIAALEQDLPKLLGSVNDAFMRISTQQSELTEIVNALVALVGEEDVAKAVMEARMARVQQESDASKAALDKAVTEGKVVAIPAITDASIIVGVEKAKDGTVKHPGRAQIGFSKLLPDFQKMLLGQAVGFTVATPEGGTFEVQEIYEAVPALAETAPAATEPVAVPAVIEPVVAPAAEVASTEAVQ
jgi:hypothetical protein